MYYVFRFSDIKQVKSLKSSWSEKMKKRAEKKSVKDFEKRLKQEKADDLEVELCLIKKNLVTCISRLKLTKLHVLKKKNIHTLYYNVFKYAL